MMRNPSGPGRRLPALILCLFVVMCVANNIALPMFEASDEAAHFAYADFLVRERRLPDLRQDLPSHEVFQPVLYYAALAPVIAPFDRSALADISLLNFDWFDAAINPNYTHVKFLHLHGAHEAWPWHPTVWAVRVARFISTLLGVITLLCIWNLGRRLYAGRLPWLAPLALALAAFNPKFIHTSSTVTNDSAVTAAATVACWWMMRLLQSGAPRLRDWFIAGALVGIAVLCKIQAIGLLLPLSALLLIAPMPARERQGEEPKPSRARPQRSGGRRGGGLGGGHMSALSKNPAPALATRFANAAIAGIGFLAITGWWLGLNTLQYGDPLAWQQTQVANAALARVPALSALEMLDRVPRLFTSFWGVLGIEKTFPVWVDGILFVALAFAVLGVVRLVAQALPAQARAGWRDFALQNPLWLPVLWAVVLLTLFLSWMRTHVGTENGRLLMPGLACIVLLVTRGWMALLPARAHAALAALAGSGMLALSIYAIPGVLLPAFAKPALLAADEMRARGMVPVQANGVLIDNRIRLLHAGVSDRVLKPGEAARITLVWGAVAPPGNSSYRTLLEAVDLRGELVARRRYLPYDGRFPTYEWRANQYFVDEYLLPIDGNAPRGVATIQLGMVAPDVQSTLLPIGGAAKLPIGQIKVDGQQQSIAAPANPLKARFGDVIQLDGFDLTAEATPTLSLHLSGLAPLPAGDDAHTYFVHTFDASGRLIWQQDQQPRMATGWWDSRDAMIEQLPIRLGPDTARIAFGWYDSRTGQRLPASDAQGNRLKDDVVTLWQK